MTYPKHYSNVLTQEIAYNNHTYFWIVVAFIILTLLAIFLPKQKKPKPAKPSKYQYAARQKASTNKRRGNDIYYRLALFLLAVALSVSGTIYTNMQDKKLQHDLQRCDFISYTGRFEYINLYKDPKSKRIDLLDEQKNIVSTLHYPTHYYKITNAETGPYPSLDEGSYYGTIVYARKSKIVLEVILNDN